MTLGPDELAAQAIAFVDGSGNAWSLDGAVLTYRPVSRAESSSGVYDGGPAWSVVLAAADRKEIVGTIARAIDRLECHGEQRVMGSGLVLVGAGEASRLVILKPRTSELAAILKALEAARPR